MQRQKSLRSLQDRADGQTPTFSSRPHRGVLIGLAVLLAMGVSGMVGLWFDASVREPIALSLLLLCVFVLPSLWGIHWYLRQRIEVGADGLRWRTARHDWQRATWDDVTDYFVEVTSGGRVGRIVLSDGRKITFGLTDWEDVKRLTEAIAANATRAKAGGWLVRGREGTITGAQIFRYTEKSRRAVKTEIGFFGWFLGLSAAGIAYLVWDAVRGGTATMGTWIGYGVLLALVVGVFGGLTRLSYKQLCWLQAHRDDIFEADEYGVALVRCEKRERVAWSEIRTLAASTDFAVGRYLLTTEHTTWELHHQLDGFTNFFSMLDQYAPQARRSRPARTVARNLLVPIEKVDGKRTFHYRTRSNRGSLAGLLLCAVVFGSVALCLDWVNRRYPVEGAPDLPVRPFLLLAMAICLGWAFFLWRYKATRLVVGNESITYFGLLGRRRVFFEEIVAVGYDHSCYIETRSGNRPIRWTMGWLAGETELLEEIERRTGVHWGGAPR